MIRPRNVAGHLLSSSSFFGRLFRGVHRIDVVITWEQKDGLRSKLFLFYSNVTDTLSRSTISERLDASVESLICDDVSGLFVSYAAGIAV